MLVIRRHYFDQNRLTHHCCLDDVRSQSGTNPESSSNIYMSENNHLYVIHC